jgi:hypothetical protein
MYVIFVTYASHEHYELRTKKFIGKDLETAETMAKEWLFEEIGHYIFDHTDIKKDALANIFRTSKLNHDLICFIQENSVVNIETEHYSH